MIKVLFVDDEVLAMEYLHNLIEWEKYGFKVVGHARNGRAAIEIFEKEKPQLVISDIKMAGMDGLELTAKLKEKDQDVMVILLSAYCDFSYAKKGIEYGVYDYLLKHELNEDTLLEKLKKVEEHLEETRKKRRIYHKYFTKQLIYASEGTDDFGKIELGNRFFLMLVHKNGFFDRGTFFEKSWNSDESEELIKLLEHTSKGIEFISEVQLSADNYIVLFRIENISSQYLVGSEIERMSRNTVTGLSTFEECSFNIIFSEEIRKKEISHTFQEMSNLIRYAIFLRPYGVYNVNRLKVFKEEERISWNGPEKELRTLIYEGEEIKNYIEYLFELVCHPTYNLLAVKELIYMLENLTRELVGIEGIQDQEETVTSPKLENIRQYYVDRLSLTRDEIQQKNQQGYSAIVGEMIRYIRKNYKNEINLESLGLRFQMNGVYLGQMFKKETGITFLKYLTKCRMEEAKRLLEKGELNISQVAAEVGYHTSQYFSQIFFKTTGIKPQEYRKWRKKQKKEDD